MKSALTDSLPLSPSVGADTERETLLDHGLGQGEVPVRVVAGGRVLGPPGREVDHGQSAAELAPEAGPAVGDGVGLHVTGKAVQLVGRLSDRDRVAQQLAPPAAWTPDPWAAPRRARA